MQPDYRIENQLLFERFSLISFQCFVTIQHVHFGENLHVATICNCCCCFATICNCCCCFELNLFDGIPLPSQRKKLVSEKKKNKLLNESLVTRGNAIALQVADKIKDITAFCPTGNAKLQVVKKIEQSSTFISVAKPVAVCNVYWATC